VSKVWKIAPGRRARQWEICRTKRCILLGWNDLDDYMAYADEGKILEALGGGPERGAGAAKSIWRFSREVQPKDIVIANKGRSMIKGLGIITGGYLPKDHVDNPAKNVDLPHARRVQWVVAQELDVGKEFFGISTVHSMSRPKIAQIRAMYAERHPELTSVLDDLFNGLTVLDDDLTDIDKAAIEMLDDGQGFITDPKLRKAIELHAMEAARLYFKSKGFTFENRSANNPYDWEFRRGEEVVYCEVKGTRSGGAQIILTNGEVDFARQNKEQMALFIFHSIVATYDGKNWQCSGGKRRLIIPWDVDAGNSTPISFTYIPPGV
jgi:hypothetical protein